MARFKAPVGYPLAASGANSRFAGMPVGMELLMDYYIFDPFTPANERSVPNATAVTDGVDWTTTAVGASTITVTDDVAPPSILLNTAGAENDGVQAQYTAATGTGEIFNLQANKRRYFGCRMSFADVAGGITAVEQCDVFLGLCITDTTVLGGATDFIGFHKADGSGVVNFVAGKNASTSGLLVDQIVRPTGVTLVAADGGAVASSTGVEHTFEFLAVGTKEVLVYADGEYRATVRSSTQLPDDENLCPSMAFLTGEAQLKFLSIRKYICAIEL